MRVLFSIIPGHGHLFPMLPMARALVDAGHEVVFATSATYGQTVLEYGFEAIASGPDYTQGSLKASDGIEALERTMFVEGPAAVADDLLAQFADQPPDVLLADLSDLGCQAAAEIGGIPFGCVLHGGHTGGWPMGWMPLDLDERRQWLADGSRGTWDRIHEAHGAEARDLWVGERAWDATLGLVQAPPSLNPWPFRSLSHTAHPLRPEIHTSDVDDEWRAAVPAGRPVVAVSLGTLFGTAELNEVIARAILAAGATPVVATSLPVDVDGAVVVPWVSMDHLMEVADGFVTHGGWGVTTAGIVSGTPMVVVPQGADQFDNAAQLAICGAGVPVLPDECSEASVAAAVTRVLEEPVHRLNAERLAAEVAAMPSAPECVPLVEELARTGGPILNR
ncbi:MAG: glycosyltransferase [Acidimicrobiia bacterium]